MENNSNNALAMVADFHRAFQHPILTEPAIPSKERMSLRMNLLIEEVNELHSAMKNNDIVEVADAFADIQYVLAGAILEFGMGTAFPDVFREVHRSNMSKACQTKEEAEATMAHYITKESTPCHYVERNGLFFVYRTSDMKTLKSIYYSPADVFGALHGGSELNPGE